MFAIRDMLNTKRTTFCDNKKRKLFAKVNFFFFLKKVKFSLKQHSGIMELQNKFTLQFSHLGPDSNVGFTNLASDR